MRVYESVTSVKGVTFAYARQNRFALRIKRQDEHIWCVECVQEEVISQSL